MNFEDEMNRFEAEINRPHYMGGSAGGGGIGSLGGFGARPKAVISAPPQTSAPPSSIASSASAGATDGNDDDEDIFAKLKKYEHDLKKEKKEAKKKAKTSFTPSSIKATSSAAAATASSTLPPPPAGTAAVAAAPPQGAAAAVVRPPGFNPFRPAAATNASTPVSATIRDDVVKKAKKLKRVVRTGGGQIWEDDSLKEWDPADFRLFCGDLGNDVTDEVLARTFGRYPSFQKAKVIRDKRTNKTRGYGFVSFKDPADFTKAVKELNGKYVGSRPIKLKKSNWRDRNIDVVRKKQKAKQEMGYKW
jgi:hypothetical protein